jgi:Prokaryotic N-terminal methylation motif
MPRRSGATLIEVLVAIFIMGIGLIALLVLFPLGALRMAKAIQDDRCSQATLTASSLANLGGVRFDSNVTSAMLFGTGGLPTPNSELKSYPVFIDSIGLRTMAGLPGANYVGQPWTTPPLLARVAPGYAPAANLQAIMKYFTLPDDLMFDNVNIPNFGYPKTLLPGVVERDTRFTWAYLAQRPRCGDPLVVDLAVVVYNSRSLSLTGNLTLPEYNYDGYDKTIPVSEVAFGLTNPGAAPFSANVARVRYEYFGHIAPQVRAGDWVLDNSYAYNDIHAYFYRVAGVTEGTETIGGKTYAYVDLEVQQPFRGFMPANGDPFTGPSVAYPNDRARLLVLEGVAEVFERSIGKTP